jgi:CRP-like cAMP-binding protein
LPGFSQSCAAPGCWPAPPSRSRCSSSCTRTCRCGSEQKRPCRTALLHHHDPLLKPLPERATFLNTSNLESPLQTPRKPNQQEGPLSQGLDVPAAAAALQRFSTARTLDAGTLLFNFDQSPDEIYLVLSGAVDVAIKRFTDSVVDAPSLNVLTSFGSGNGSAIGNSDGARPMPTERHFCCGPGSVFGGTDFVLQRPRSFRAVASAPSAVLALGRDAYHLMAAASPQAAAFLQVGGVLAIGFILGRGGGRVSQVWRGRRRLTRSNRSNSHGHLHLNMYRTPRSSSCCATPARARCTPTSCWRGRCWREGRGRGAVRAVFGCFSALPFPASLSCSARI